MSPEERPTNCTGGNNNMDLASQLVSRSPVSKDALGFSRPASSTQTLMKNPSSSKNDSTKGSSTTNDESIKGNPPNPGHAIADSWIAVRKLMDRILGKTKCSTLMEYEQKDEMHSGHTEPPPCTKDGKDAEEIITPNVSLQSSVGNHSGEQNEKNSEDGHPDCCKSDSTRIGKVIEDDILLLLARKKSDDDDDKTNASKTVGSPSKKAPTKILLESKVRTARKLSVDPSSSAPTFCSPSNESAVPCSRPNEKVVINLLSDDDGEIPCSRQNEKVVINLLSDNDGDNFADERPGGSTKLARSNAGARTERFQNLPFPASQLYLSKSMTSPEKPKSESKSSQSNAPASDPKGSATISETRPRQPESLCSKHSEYIANFLLNLMCEEHHFVGTTFWTKRALAEAVVFVSATPNSFAGGIKLLFDRDLIKTGYSRGTVVLSSKAISQKTTSRRKPPETLLELHESFLNWIEEKTITNGVTMVRKLWKILKDRNSHSIESLAATVGVKIVTLKSYKILGLMKAMGLLECRSNCVQMTDKAFPPNLMTRHAPVKSLPTSIKKLVPAVVFNNVPKVSPPNAQEASGSASIIANDPSTPPLDLGESNIGAPALSLQKQDYKQGTGEQEPPPTNTTVIRLTLPNGPLGVFARADSNGCCKVHSIKNPSLSCDFRVGDIISSINGTLLQVNPSKRSEMERSHEKWGKLLYTRPPSSVATIIRKVSTAVLQSDEKSSAQTPSKRPLSLPVKRKQNEVIDQTIESKKLRSKKDDDSVSKTIANSSPLNLSMKGSPPTANRGIRGSKQNLLSLSANQALDGTYSQTSESNILETKHTHRLSAHANSSRTNNQPAIFSISNRTKRRSIEKKQKLTAMAAAKVMEIFPDADEHYVKGKLREQENDVDAVVSLLLRYSRQRGGRNTNRDIRGNRSVKARKRRGEYTSQATPISTRVAKEQVQSKMALENGPAITCCCCFGEVERSDCIPCKEDGHLICKDCMVQYVETQIYGRGNLGIDKESKKPSMEIKCCHQNGCNSGYRDELLRKCLSQKTWEKYSEMVTMAHIQSAGLGHNLAMCPKCGYQAVVPEGQNSFKCPIDKCRFESCLKCKRASHAPFRCEEIIDQERNRRRDNGRLGIEEALSEAKIRTCPNCKMKIIKSSGCNKMTCACGQKMCYVCREPLDKNKAKAYSHFCQKPFCDHKHCGKCSLYTRDEEDDAQAMLEAGIAAKEAFQLKSPNEDLNLDVDAMMRDPVRPGGRVPRRRRRRPNRFGYY